MAFFRLELRLDAQHIYAPHNVILLVSNLNAPKKKKNKHHHYGLITIFPFWGNSFQIVIVGLSEGCEAVLV